MMVPRLVDVLIDMGADARSMSSAAREYYRQERFGEWLVSRGIVTQNKLTLALARQAAARGDYSAARSFVGEAAKSMQQATLGALDAFRVAGAELSTVSQP